MNEILQISDSDLDDLFEKYRRSPDSYVFVPLADAVRKMGRQSEALEICEKGLAQHPGYASGHVVKGKCLYDLGRDREAIEAFDAVLRMDENNLVALKYLGMIEARAGRFDTARSLFNHILRLDPENREIKRVLSEVIEKAEGSSPRSAQEDTGARPTEGEPAGSEPETSEELATITLADIFLSQGYEEKALRIYQELLARQPDNDVVKQKLAALKAGASADLAETESGDSGLEHAAAETDTGFEEIAAERATTSAASRVSKDATTAKGAQTAAGESDAPTPAPMRRPIDEEKDIEHFKRWLGRFR